MRGGKPILEDLAIASSCLPEASRRNTGCAMERAYEIGQITETDIECNIGNGLGLVGQQARCMTQPRADQVLVRGNAEHACEKPQEMKCTQAGLFRCTLQIDRLIGMRVHPERRFDGAAPIVQARLHGLAMALGDDLDKASR